jgi:hypothetical protein
VTQPSQTPVRFFTGVATDQPFQPLAFYGNRNPFFYHEWEDDFDVFNAAYVATKTTGTAGVIAGDGGILQLVTAATLNDLTSIQLPAASFSFTAGKKSFFLCRLSIDDATNGEFNVGLMNTTATPFAPTDGLYFKKAAGATTLVLASMNGSVETDIAIPASLYPANATNIDLGWYVDRKQNVFAYVGNPLVGYVQQNVASLGPNAKGTPALTAANLNLTLAVGAGTAAARTMKVDFAMAAKER